MSLQRNALILMLLTALLGVFGQWNPALGHWWCLPAGLLLAGLAYESATVGRCDLRMRAVAPQRWMLGRSLPIGFVFSQNTREAVTIQAALSAPDTFAAEPRVVTLRVARDLDTTVELHARARRLGREAWPSPRLRIAGPLRLAWWTRRIAASCPVTVIPDAITRFTGHTGESAMGEQRTRLTGSGTEVVQLRDYRHGDPLRAIDWKASARRGRLISRELAEERHLEIMIAIDAGRASGLAAGEIDRFGLYVNIASRLAQRAVELGDAVGVMLFAEHPLGLVPPTRGPAAVTRIRAILTAGTVQPGESNPALAAARIRTLLHRRTLIVLLTDLQDASAEELAQAVKLLRAKHFVFIGGLENARIATLPLAPASDPLDPYRALAATEYRETLAGNVRALRALGAAALATFPEHLDRAVLDAYGEFRRQRRV